MSDCPRKLTAFLVDPSLFTAPYDAALTNGLLAAGVDPMWAVRPTRPGDAEQIPPQFADAFFYRRSDQLAASGAKRAAAKGLAHVLGLTRLVRRVRSRRPQVVHFQWTVLPPIDALAIAAIRSHCPVVLTVHDTVPFNGEHVSLLQNSVFDLPMKLSDQLIVHTAAARERLIDRGIEAKKISVIPHGPLSLTLKPQALERTDPRWTCVLFGELKEYKGLDILIEAINRLPTEVQLQSRFVVAGRPRMDLTPMLARIRELGLDRVIEVQPKRFTEQEMSDLFHATDCFLFPYRQIDASGVYFLVKGLRKWIIASRVGIFAEDVHEGAQGSLVEPGDVSQLSEALLAAVTKRPAPSETPIGEDWLTIGEATRRVYERAMQASP